MKTFAQTAYKPCLRLSQSQTHKDWKQLFKQSIQSFKQAATLKLVKHLNRHLQNQMQRKILERMNDMCLMLCSKFFF